MKAENTNEEKEELLIKHEIEVIEGILESKSKYRKIISGRHRSLGEGLSGWANRDQDGRRI